VVGYVPCFTDRPACGHVCGATCSLFNADGCDQLRAGGSCHVASTSSRDPCCRLICDERTESPNIGLFDGAVFKLCAKGFSTERVRNISIAPILSTRLLPLQDSERL
jgi:hypothetical protein